MISLIKFKEDLEKNICPDHKEHPTVKIIRDHLELTACCDKFHAILERKLDDSLYSQIDESLDSIFKKLR